MAKVVSAITATVEVIGKLKDGNYGPYRSVLFLDQAQPVGSEAAKIWKSLSEAEAAPLSKGARVQLVPAGKDRSGKDKHNIVLLEGQAVSAPDSSASVPDCQRPRFLCDRARFRRLGRMSRSGRCLLQFVTMRMCCGSV